MAPSAQARQFRIFMAVKSSLTQSPPTHEITLSFSAGELAQIEAFSALHGVSALDFIRGAALSAAQIAPKAQQQPDGDTSWLTETASPSVPEVDLWALETSPAKTAETSPRAITTLRATTNDQNLSQNRGTVGVASTLAKGSGPVREIRQALGNERVHGLGWTREQLAFVLKMSVVGVRKMEHLGKTPNRNLESRRSLLALAQTLRHPSDAIVSFIASETAALANSQ